MCEIFGQEAANTFPALPINPTTSPQMATAESEARQTSGSKSRQSKETTHSKTSGTSSVTSSKDKKGSKKPSSKPKKLYWDAITPPVSSKDATMPKSGRDSEGGASVKSELKAL
jgi:hypothetical protein